jgi:hypothetical protein
MKGREFGKRSGAISEALHRCGKRKANEKYIEAG